LKQKEIKEGILSFIRIISDVNMNGLDIEDPPSHVVQRFCDELKSGIREHGNVSLSYCPERKHILYKFVGDKDWALVCDFLTTGTLSFN